MIRSPGPRAALLLAVLVTPLFGLLLSPRPAEAHAYVVATAPANGAELDTAPTAVLVTFDEPVTLSSTADAVSVLDADGRRVDVGRGRLESDRRVLRIGIRAGLVRGTYLASWSVVSADTHPVGGSIQFGYRMPAGAISTPAGRRPSAGWELAVGASKSLVYLGLVAALGLLPAALVLGVDDRERRLLVRAARSGAVVVAVGSVAQVVAQYLWQSSAIPGAATGTGLRDFAASSYAIAVYLRLGLLALVVVPRTSRRPRRETAAGLLALAVLGTVVRNGHGGSGAWWQFGSTLLHVAAVTAWLGGLATLGWLVLRQRLTAARLRRLPLWSGYAAAAVTALVISGLVQAVVEVHFPGALLTTTYGYLLLAKVLLVAVAITLGWRGFRWIRRQLAGAGDADGQPAPGQTAALRGRVRREAAVGAVVVLLSGVLSSITPAEAAYAPRRAVRAAIGPYAVAIAIGPARRGPESFRIVVAGRADDTPLPQSLLLELSQRAGPVRGLRVSFPYRLPGAIRPEVPTPITFSSTSVDVPVRGAWTGTLTVVAGRTEQYTAAFDFLVS